MQPILPKMPGVKEKYIKLRKVLRHNDIYAQYLAAATFFSDDDTRRVEVVKKGSPFSQKLGRKEDIIDTKAFFDPLNIANRDR